jgi:RNA polymerase subunit RPABC4/transcription elongation factor Spt4
MTTPETCPTCGEDVPRHARACPHCGADEFTGWSEDAQQATAADLGIPDEDFDYDKFVKREFGGRSPKPEGLRWGWWLMAILLLAAILFTWIL